MTRCEVCAHDFTWGLNEPLAGCLLCPECVWQIDDDARRERLEAAVRCWVFGEGRRL